MASDIASIPRCPRKIALHQKISRSFCQSKSSRHGRVNRPLDGLGWCMALGATVYNFKIELADSDRGVYAPLDLRAARHPSETEDHLLTRVLAYCLEYTEGIGFS